MASLDLSTTTLVSLGVSLMPSKWKHSLSDIVDSLISRIVDSLISHIVESLISMEWTSSLSEQPSKEEDNIRGVEVKLLESKMSSLNSFGVSLLLSMCMWLSSLRGVCFFLSHRLSRVVDGLHHALEGEVVDDGHGDSHGWSGKKIMRYA
jgi:hypothetical protein